MIHHKHILRTLQLFTVVTMGAIIVFVLSLLGVFDKPADIERGANETENAQTGTVKRPKTVKNLTYQQYLQQGDDQKYKLNLDKALESYQQAAQLEPREFIVYEKIGDTYFLQKKYDAAMQTFELANSMGQKKDTITLKIARCLLGLRKVVDARTKLDEINPPTIESLYYGGLIAAFLNEQDKAKELLSNVAANSKDENMKVMAQKVLDNFRDFELARESNAEFLQAMLAQSFDQAGEYGMAIELAFNALKTQHDYRDVWIVLGHAYLNEQKWFDAEDALTKAIALDSSHPASYFFRGMAKRNLNKFTEAATDFEKALKLGWKPQIIAKQYLADSYFDTKDFTKAFPLYKETATTDPSDINRFVRPIALAINQLNKPKEATDLANVAFKTHPGSAMAYNLLGWAAIANNDLVGAHKNLSEALKLDPNLDAAHLNLGQLYEREGKIDSAMREYQLAADFAEKSANESVGNTATLRYNELTSPQTTNTKPIPSLSLQ